MKCVFGAAGLKPTTLRWEHFRQEALLRRRGRCVRGAKVGLGLANGQFRTARVTSESVSCS